MRKCQAAKDSYASCMNIYRTAFSTSPKSEFKSKFKIPRNLFLFSVILLCVASLLIGCATLKTLTPNERIQELERKAKVMRPKVEAYGSGGIEVFNAAVEGLKAGYAEGKYSLVSIEDLWTETLQEGAVLFNKPDRLWGATPANETGDMLGQTTIGPWQITVWNVQDTYGPPYGLPPKITPREVVEWCKARPAIQARMIADYIQNAYTTYGRRGPYAIQSYFWLEPFAKDEIGQSKEWWKSPVAKPPKGGTWKDLTPEMKKDTGFYGKQIICGCTHQIRGLLYWLAITDDIKAMDDLLRVWRDEPKRSWVAEKKMAVLTDKPGNFVLSPEDLRFWPEEDKDLRPVVEKRMLIIKEESKKK